MTSSATSLIARDIDIFPAKVDVRISQVTHNTYGKARIRFTKNDNTLRVWAEGTQFPHTPILIIETVVLAILANSIGDNSVIRRKQRLMVEVPDTNGLSSVIEISPQAGCGCGSRLKSMRFDQLATDTATPQIARPLTDHKGPVLDDLQRVMANNWPNA